MPQAELAVLVGAPVAQSLERAIFSPFVAGVRVATLASLLPLAGQEAARYTSCLAPKSSLETACPRVASLQMVEEVPALRTAVSASPRIPAEALGARFSSKRLLWKVVTAADSRPTVVAGRALARTAPMVASAFYQLPGETAAAQIPAG